MTQARTFRYPDILVGMKEERNYVLSPEVYEHFLAAFDDRSPIHVTGHIKVYQQRSLQNVPPWGGCFLTGWRGCLQGGISDLRRSRFAAAGC